MASELFFNCNTCYAGFTTNLQFSLTSCFHIYCNNCLRKGAIQNQVCYICSSKCQIVPLNQEFTKHKASLLFSNPQVQLEKLMKETQSIIQAYQFQTAQLKHLITGLRKENSECRRVELQRRLERQQQFLTPALSSATHLTPETPANGFGNNATAPGSNSSNKICLPSFPAPKRKTPAAATQQNGQVANGVTSRISMSNASGQRQMMSQGSQNGRYSSYSNQPAQPMSVVPQSATQIRTINDAQQYGYQTPNNRTLMEMSQQKSIIGVNSDRITLKPRLSNSFQSPSVAQMMPNMSQQGTQNYNGLNSTPTSYPHSMTSSTMRGKKTTPRAEVPPYQQQGNHNYRKL